MIDPMDETYTWQTTEYPVPKPEDVSTEEDACARACRRLLGDALVDDKVSPVASAARSAFRMGWNARAEEV